MGIKKVLYRHYRFSSADIHSLPTKGPPPKGMFLRRAYRRRDGKFGDWLFRCHGVAPKGGVTECILIIDTGAEIMGEAFCSMADGFCKKTGRELAYERAINQLDST